MTTVELTPEFIETELRGFPIEDRRWVVPLGPHSVTFHAAGEHWVLTGQTNKRYTLSVRSYWAELAAALFTVGRWTGDYELRSRVEGVLNR